MSLDIFLQNFKNYSESDLMQVINNKEIYVEDAREAANQILLKRKVDNENLLENNCQNKLQDKTNAPLIVNSIDLKSNKSLLTDDINAPKLHSKMVIRVFAILFSTIYGTMLLMTNLKEVNNSLARTQVLIFGIIYSLLSIVLITFFDTRSLAMPLNCIGSWVLTEYFWNKYIGKETLYRKRNWYKALIISILVTIPLILATIYNR